MSYVARKSGQGYGSTWPGHIALKLNKNFIRDVLKKNQMSSRTIERDLKGTSPRHLADQNNKQEGNLRVILIAGTNGKTTTTKLIKYILEKNGLRVFQNESGANLLNGVASTLIKYSNNFGKLTYDVALFEIDENTLSHVLKEITPDAILLLNLFRDQLDRYGEVNTIAHKWTEALSQLSSWPKPGSKDVITNKMDSGRARMTGEINNKKPILFMNGDDPELSYLGKKSGMETHYFGVQDKYLTKKEIPHDVDFLYCPECNTKLEFKRMSYSHMGDFLCPKCSFLRPEIEMINNLPYPLFGTYNVYNTNAAALLVNVAFNINEEKIIESLKNFKPAFGRQEVLEYKGRKIIILLSKNPTGFNQSIKAMTGLHPGNTGSLYNTLILLNDRIPDGRDVSWIWDVDFEKLKNIQGLIYVSGDRAYDMALRLQYAEINLPDSRIHNDLEKGIENAVEDTNENETLFILTTYSAMLEARKIISGRKIL